MKTTEKNILLGPIIQELDNLVPNYPLTGNPKDEAIYFAYQQSRVAYSMLCNLLQAKLDVIGIYIYSWSIVDNVDRFFKLMKRRNKNLKDIRDAFQHMDEKMELFKKGSIPVFGSISYWLKLPDGVPEFCFFPKSIGRTFCVGVMNNTDPCHDGVSHLTLSSLKSEGKNGTGTGQLTLRLDKMVLDMGREVCDMFGILSKEA